MPDNLKIKQPEDPTKINIHETWEVNYWTDKFGISAGELIAAVRAVGVSVAAVKAYLNK
jgi:Protein of unknown function (DUF3606)